MVEFVKLFSVYFKAFVVVSLYLWEQKLYYVYLIVRLLIGIIWLAILKMDSFMLHFALW